jgi:hypothetical protein
MQEARDEREFALIRRQTTESKEIHIKLAEEYELAAAKLICDHYAMALDHGKEVTMLLPESS